MPNIAASFASDAAPDEPILAQYERVRAQSMRLIKGLSAEDMMLQSMPDASPTKWHLAHTSWFFETFLLQPHLTGYQSFDDAYQYLFNSYYDTVGERHPRPQRGLLSRPSLEEVIAYRHHVDEAMQQLLQTTDAEIEAAVTIGLHHEMQHQELLQTDIKHALSLNPYALPTSNTTRAPSQTPDSADFVEFEGGLSWLGTNAESSFAYDCEQPRHQVFVPDFSLCERLVTNAEWLEFMADNGYQRPKLWLSDGWATAQQENWQAPLYWYQQDNQWWTITGQQRRPLDPNAPVCHISYYEADAFARWRGCRLPTEFEWEHAARAMDLKGHFLESGHSLPQPATSEAKGLKQMFGDAWEWTQSPFSPYPGFKTPEGALAEYNGKFMANQWVLRGGSCATAAQQMRLTYRNFFYAHQRWQFTSLRLAK
ncbi:ergothioneine biosynthesis protein EgtB [Pseudidiomarina sp. 1APP75-32.1]|uniref:Ergothioneine biosynthesis protein EgtB n=1 Tax=Pseudidiomarina terrestris TaxID=2820060 RepID=A0AAW7R162_9GAMM|nr:MULTISPECIES: ergothioneine biosynthesis protein EgtB [unclassified Pseudidiomarina]MDN7125487.1 ergothioneine biosynthesis protein EgtB [Pseudidiomarina sp. 1APP75-32.1]MDN7130245.1 ergothioneine biosynthesis protein EgtB [Pseudidiomarina sp. 1APR75-15]